ARHRIRPADDADDEIPGDEPTVGRRKFHPAERFMAEDQPLFARRGSAILAGDDVAVGPAHPERHRADQQPTVREWWFGDILEASRILNSRRHCQCEHFVTPSIRRPPNRYAP